MASVMSAYDAGGGRVEVLPALLARACVEVLPVTGAGVSFTDELRIPLGASDDMAVRAERLQTTLGEGPCLTATATSSALRATGTLMSDRWPIFYQELLRQTPYRTIASIPLHSKQRERFGALDLYSDDEDGLSDLVLAQVTTHVADPIAAILFDSPTTSYQQHQDMPSWLASDAVTDRMTVWIAIGMLMEEGVMTNGAALATLRAYAFTHDSTLDELAARLVDQDLAVLVVLGP